MKNMIKYINSFEKALKKGKKKEDINNFKMVNILCVSCLKTLTQGHLLVIDGYPIDKWVDYLVKNATAYFDRYYWIGYQRTRRYPADLVEVAEVLLKEYAPFDELLYIAIKLTKAHHHFYK